MGLNRETEVLVIRRGPRGLCGRISGGDLGDGSDPGRYGGAAGGNVCLGAVFRQKRFSIWLNLYIMPSNPRRWG